MARRAYRRGRYARRRGYRRRKTSTVSARTRRFRKRVQRTSRFRRYRNYGVARGIRNLRAIRPRPTTVKLDRLIGWTNMVGDETPGDYQPNGPTLRADNVTVMLWCPTARSSRTFANSAIRPVSERSSSKCYFSGFKEKLTFAQSRADGSYWRWRRIIFRSIHTQWRQEQSNAKVAYYDKAGGRGVVRVWNDFYNPSSPMRPIMESILNPAYKPASMIDGKLNINAWRILSDRRRTIRPRMDNGWYVTYNKWHPCNSYITYADEFSVSKGESNSSLWSTQRIFDKGDVYVMDVFENAVGSEEVTLDIRPETTVYWREYPE